MKDLLSKLNVSRRQVLGMISAGTAGLLLPGKIQAAAAQTKAKSVIQIWMWGGPCHIDTFDPKPDAGYDFCGPLNKAIASNVDGIQLGDSLPLLAKMADKYSIIRSMTHGQNGHETASYMMQTGRMSGGLVHPCIGAVVSYCKGYAAGYKSMIPPYIVITRPQGRFSEAGFLGMRYKPFATGGNPADKRFAVEGIVSKDVTPERQINRRSLLEKLDMLEKAAPQDQTVALAKKHKEEAWELILGSAGKVFDLNDEKPELREEYGNNPFGQACLVARRLAESGVPYITINYEGWDTHKQHFILMRTKMPQLDKGMSTLLRDLENRGLLDSTLVWWGGEFGRTPRVQWEAPWNGGRNHFGKVFSVVLAGGGIKGGRVVGSTNATGEEVKDRPVYPWDLTGTLYQLMGIRPDFTVKGPQGQDIRITPGPEEKLTSGGYLRELV
ncbi:MAG: hypothetical protein A2096_16330 [Spirochaetes bacterium GWF1_41_5]|nr:MAG: hypothetical protein A2096_16330 [Spirochaetes bacterium GWF1_41_5]HBE01762.1 DUF1501 domain-containing protein [Spirochaetia bacterium]